MKAVKNILLWICSVFLLLMTLGMFSESFFGGLLMLLAALLCNPLVLKEKTGVLSRCIRRWDGMSPKGKKRIIIPSVIILFLASMSTMSVSGQAQSGTVAVTQTADTALAQEELVQEEETEAEDAEEAGGSVESQSQEKAWGGDADQSAEESQNQEQGGDESLNGNEEEENGSDASEASELTVHFMDIGQGDAILIACDGEYMLIDAGGNDKGTAVQNYLTKQGVDRLKYVVGTHPDADHIGGLDVILYKFDCDTIIMPDIDNNTATYRDVIDTMDIKGYQNTLPQTGDCYALGGAEFTILGPEKHYSDTNNSSVVIRLTHGTNSFLFMGDAEEEAEADLVNGDGVVEADVLKVGHHGSRTASSETFLQAVSPTYAVISCGEDNSYGHPHAETLNHLRAMGAQVFRTDEQGTIVAVSDGESLEWNCAPSETWKAGENTQSGDSTKAVSGTGTGSKTSSSTGAASTTGSSTATVTETQSAEEQAQVTSAGTDNTNNLETGEATAGGNYIGNKNNGKLHRATCHTLPKPENQVIFNTREEAVAAGYDDPCGNCNP